MDSRIINALVAEFGLDLLQLNDELRLGTAVAPAHYNKDQVAELEYIKEVFAGVSKNKNGRIFLEDWSEQFAELIQDAILDGRLNDLPFIAGAYETFLKKNGIAAPAKGSADEKELLHAMAHAAKTVWMIERERIQGIRDESELQHRIISRWEKDRPVQKDPGIPLSELFDRYFENWPITDTGRRIKKKAELKRTLRSHIECFGQISGAKEITKEVAEEWRNYIHHEFDKETLKNKTVNNYLETLSAIFNFGLKSKMKYVDIQPFKGLSLPIGVASEKTRIFEDSELQIYVNYLVALYIPERPETTWLPIIMMFSGMRCNEIAQLYIDDVQERDGLHFFRVTDNMELNQKLKTETSKREVPIHAALINMGFLKYVNNMRQTGHQQVFPNCIYKENIGLYYDSALSVLLNSPINLIDKSKKLRLYSLRSNFRNCIEEKFLH